MSKKLIMDENEVITGKEVLHNISCNKGCVLAVGKSNGKVYKGYLHTNNLKTNFAWGSLISTNWNYLIFNQIENFEDCINMLNKSFDFYYVDNMHDFFRALKSIKSESEKLFSRNVQCDLSPHVMPNRGNKP